MYEVINMESTPQIYGAEKLLEESELLELIPYSVPYEFRYVSVSVSSFFNYLLDDVVEFLRDCNTSIALLGHFRSPSTVIPRNLSVNMWYYSVLYHIVPDSIKQYGTIQYYGG